jgi:hypothetical protein
MVKGVKPVLTPVFRRGGLHMTLDEHYRNREALPEAELAPYYGKHVAWNMEGTKIVASGGDDGEVIEAVQRAGLDLGQVVISYIYGPDEVEMGGAFMFEGQDEL